MPPYKALTWPSSDDPTPNGMIGHLNFWQISTVFLTSISFSAKTTPSGSFEGCIVVVSVCCSLTLFEIENCWPNSFVNSVIASFLLNSKLKSDISNTGQVLKKRLPVYPEFIKKEWLNSKIHEKVNNIIDTDGYPKDHYE